MQRVALFIHHHHHNTTTTMGSLDLVCIRGRREPRGRRGGGDFSGVFFPYCFFLDLYTKPKANCKRVAFSWGSRDGLLLT